MKIIMYYYYYYYYYYYDFNNEFPHEVDFGGPLNLFKLKEVYKVNATFANGRIRISGGKLIFLVLKNTLIYVHLHW